MGNRPEVETARAPIVALDVSLLAGHFATALARVPFRHPFRGQSSPLSNLGITVTREVIRAFMGYSSSLRIPAADASSGLTSSGTCPATGIPAARASSISAAKSTPLARHFCVRARRSRPSLS